jgi:hypothetical protein
MNNTYIDILAGLRINLKKIIGLYESEKELNKVLKRQNELLLKEISLLKKENEELKIQYNKIDLANVFVNASGTTHDAKIKVNRIVREIDKCIALLNK